jgi:hypothetical protein
MPITQITGERRTAKADALAFLQVALAGDPVPATEVSRMAHEHGLTAKAIRSAREALGVRIERNGFGPGSRSLWSLPSAHPDAHPIPISSEEDRRPKTIDGHEVIRLEPDDPCTYCGERDGTVYLIRNTYKGLSEPMHESCAVAWFGWPRVLRERGGHGQF